MPPSPPRPPSRSGSGAGGRMTGPPPDWLRRPPWVGVPGGEGGAERDQAPPSPPVPPPSGIGRILRNMLPYRGAAWPVHDLFLNDVLAFLLPTHLSTLLLKFGLVLAALFLLPVWASWEARRRDGAVTSLAATVQIAILLLPSAAWIRYYRRVLQLAGRMCYPGGFSSSFDGACLSWLADPTIPAVNREPVCARLRYFASESVARKAAPIARLVHSHDPNPAVRTPHIVNLDTDPSAEREWRFRLFENPEAAFEAVRALYNDGFADGGDDQKDADQNSSSSTTWKPLVVPSNWTREGYDKPIYTNQKYPFPCTPPLAPEDNPTGVYQTIIQIDDDANDANAYKVLFHGVESAWYVFWNGRFAGFSKDSRLEAEFDVTPYVKGGPNELVVAVARFCDASYVEDQDHWWMAGIHRSVELVLTPCRSMCSGGAPLLQDFRVQADAKGRLACRVECHVPQSAPAEPAPTVETTVTARLYSDQARSADGDDLELGECLWSHTQTVRRLHDDDPEVQGWWGCHFSAQLENVVQLWTAETPNLYTLTLEVRSGDRVHQAESCRVGFRTVEVQEGRVTVNGRSITVCGMNRHEFDPDHGKTVPLARTKQDLCLLKQNNFNSVRTSHYPNHPSFYKLCDYYGLYVCDEANLETHGMKPMGRLAHDSGWENTFVSRVMRMVHRDSNHACILYWSLGNESGRGRNLSEARRLVKEWDPTRPVVYESGGGLAEGTGHTELTDVVCTMYPDVDRAVRLATTPGDKRPVVLCEYSHSMNNSNGNLHLYWDAFWDPDVPRLQGGYIWDMIDQGLRIPSPQPPGYFYGYGGDFGDTINDLQFCLNGMWSPDREPHPTVSEIRFLMQPVAFVPLDGLDDGSVKVGELQHTVSLKVINRYNFRDLSHLSWVWELKSDQVAEALCTGKFEISTDRCHIRLDKALPKIHELERSRPLAGNSYFLNIRGSLKAGTSWAEPGHVLVTQQFAVTLVNPPAAVLAAPTAPCTSAPLKVIVTEAQVEIWRHAPHGEPSLLVAIERERGSLCHYAPRDRNVLVGGVLPNFTRATTDNDRGGLELALNFLFPGFLSMGFHGCFHGSQDFSYWSRWRNVGLSQEAPPSSTCALAEVTYNDGEKVDVDIVCHIQSSNGGSRGFPRLLFTVTTHYTIYRDGSVRLATHVNPSPVLRKLPSIARVGVTFQLDPSLHRVQYFGRGPGENYPDRKSGAELGVYDTSPSAMGYTYAMPMENGSRSDCRWIAFRSPEEDGGSGVCVAAEYGGSFSCSALLHSASELESALHTCDLECRKDGSHPIHCCIDHRHMGLGGDTSWYPVVYPQYRVPPTKDFQYSLWLLPLDAKDRPAFVAGNV